MLPKPPSILKFLIHLLQIDDVAALHLQFVISTRVVIIYRGLGTSPTKEARGQERDRGKCRTDITYGGPQDNHRAERWGVVQALPAPCRPFSQGLVGRG